MAFARPVLAQPPGAPAPADRPPPVAAPSSPEDILRAYQAALARRRPGAAVELTAAGLRARVAQAEDAARAGRVDEAIATVMAATELPGFVPLAQSEEGQAATWLLGDTLATAGVYGPARAALTRLLLRPGVWDGTATFARRAVRRLVEIGAQSDDPRAVLTDLAVVPAEAPAETRGDIAYLTGRAREAAGDAEGAMMAYADVAPSSRFWAQAVYRHGLLLVEGRRYKEGEALFCAIADPGRKDRTSPTFGDERYFAVRDLARLALGRLAHEQSRFDDARYYYYLVPRDSDRLAEALYEAATSRYEKRDYGGARELLGDLAALGQLRGHHRYEDEARLLNVYVDLAECKFEVADGKVKAFLSDYGPVLEAVRRLQADDAGARAVVRAARSGGSSGGTDALGAVASSPTLQTILSLVQTDAAYGEARSREAVLDAEASGLERARIELADVEQGLSSPGSLRAVGEVEPDRRGADLRRALDGTRRALAELEAAHAPDERLRPLRNQVAVLEASLSAPRQPAAVAASPPGASGDELLDLVRVDAERARALIARAQAMRARLEVEETRLARDAVRRLDLRLSRLLRRARLARIESVLGRKRTLEIEIEAINDGVIPRGAVDSLDPAPFLRDGEEYWPFEGDDWPDEFVGSEVPK
jgi:hypothetical protein